MTPNTILGRRLFVDGIVRPVSIDDTGAQYVIDLDVHARLYGVWLAPEPDEADAPFVVPESSRRPPR